MDRQTQRKILWLRISYWVGAILDAIWCLPMLIPQWGGLMFGLKNFNPSGEFRYVLGTCAALMFGWTCLLIWADRKPVERRGILLLTIVPVKVCLDISKIFLLVYHVISLEKLLVSSIDAVVLYVLFIYSYVNSRSLVQTGKE